MKGANMNEYSMMHGIDWTGQDVAGWVITEKYDGVRAYWDGSTLWTRGGNAIAVPASWRDELPAMSIDAELFAGYGKQRQAVSAARYGRFTDDMRLMVFDAPGVRGDYAARLSSVITGRAAQAVKVTMGESTAHALQLMRRVQQSGGEGLMLRHPAIEYHPGRSSQMLKLKSEVIL
jgi:DNA ligase-1